MTKCHCGKSLHYTNPETQKLIEKIIEEKGEFVVVQVGQRKFNVQRHYIALHGLRAQQLPDLGFEEIN